MPSLLTKHYQEIPVNIMIEIPVEYPDIPFSALLRCSRFNRQQHVRINADAARYVAELDTGDMSVNSLIDWLRENLCHYSARVEHTEESRGLDDEVSYARLWIYSHHLYSKAKKTSIKDWCKEMGLDGFFLAGKPGIICVEGLREHTSMFWWNIRHLNWQRIVLKEEQSITTRPSSDKLGGWKKFSDFREVTFTNSPENADFSLFIKWLKDLRFNDIIPILFGIEAR